jgi:hypothetical protein
MSKANKLFFALALGLSAAAFGTQAMAQVVQPSPERRAAIHRCSVQAQRQFPSENQDDLRTESYMSCMTTAGFAP